MKAKLTLTYGTHRQHHVVWLSFSFSREHINCVKNFAYIHYSNTNKCWYVLQTEYVPQALVDDLSHKFAIDFSQVNTTATTRKETPVVPQENIAKPPRPDVKLPKGYHDILIQKRYSQNTIKIYTAYFKDFVFYFKDKILETLTTNDINKYVLYLIENYNISPSQQNQRINAIKFYYEKVLGRHKQYYHIDRPNSFDSLPKVLSKEEIKQILNATNNTKHKCILSLIYSSGLRRGELINLKITDISSERLQIRIASGKGGKDRYSLLSHGLIAQLRDYYTQYKPQLWLFEGVDGRQYSASSVANILRNAAKKAGLRKRVTPHMLRHSFATHLLEQGVDIRHIQLLLGHNSTKTTEIYTHVSTHEIGKIINPLDEILGKI